MPRDIDLTDWLNGMGYHPPNTELQQLGHEATRRLVAQLGARLHPILPAGPDKDTVFSLLQDVLMRANRALAIGGGPDPQQVTAETLRRTLADATFDTVTLGAPPEDPRVQQPQPDDNGERLRYQRELVRQLHFVVARSWAGVLPPDLRHCTLKDRLDGVVNSVITELEGAGGVEPHRLSPKSNPTLDLMHLPDRSLRYALQDDGDRTGLPADAETFVQGILEVRDSVLRRNALGTRDPVIAFIESVCQLIEDLYILVPLTYDEDSGEKVGEREDIAPGLACAYREADRIRGGHK